MGHCRPALHRVQELLQLSRRKELGCWLQHWLSNVEDQNFLPLLLSRQPGNTPLAELQAVDCAAAEHDVPHDTKLHAGMRHVGGTDPSLAQAQSCRCLATSDCSLHHDLPARQASHSMRII